MYGSVRNDEADEYINEFVLEFYKRFKVTPIVLYDMKDEAKRLPLNLLEQAVNRSLFTMIDQRRCPEGIRTKWRKREVVLHRQVYMMIAHEWTYTLEDVGRSLGYDHATVLHAGKLIKNLLEAKDKLTVQIVNSIFYAIKQEFQNDGDISTDSLSGNVTESVLPDDLIEGKDTNSTSEPSC